MEMSPKQVRTATFGSARKGYDPAEVSAYLDRVAEALESAQNHATAMEARARAAIAKLQELSSAEQATPAPDRSVEVAQTETISRTLLLAQRAADEAVADARAEAERVLEAARAQASTVGAEEREKARGEVEALRARREFLQSDVEQLENFLLDQRERLRSAAAELVSLAEKVPGGLGYLRPPLLSASDDDTAADDASAGPSLDVAADADEGGAPTEALPRIVLSDEDDDNTIDATPGDTTGDDTTPEAGQMRFVPSGDEGDDEGAHEADTADRSGS